MFMKLAPYDGSWTGESAYHPNDPLTGTEILQLTGSVAQATNIYCEDPACSPGGLIAVVRSPWCNPRAPAELWVADVASGRMAWVDTDITWHGACPQAYGDLFFYLRYRQGRRELARLRFSSLEVQPVHDLGEDKDTFVTLGSASPDGRFLVNDRRLGETQHETVVLDLDNGRLTPLAAGEEFFNPHPRFDRMEGQWVLIQHNRGWRMAEGKLPELVDPAARVTLHLARRDGSELRDLPVACPAIPQGVSGHESWLKGQPAFVYSLTPLDPPHDDGRRIGNLVLYRLGEAGPTVLAHAPDIYFGHVSTSACGTYWLCDAFPWPHDGSDCCRVAPRIAVGCIATGRWAYVCETGGQVWPRYENGHAHPFLTADNRHIIFTSMRTGLPQVFRATVPVGLLEDLAKP